MINLQQIEMQESAMTIDTVALLVARVKPLMDEIDITTDCAPTMIGSINSVASSGEAPTENAIKLLILKGRKEISMDEYRDLALYFAKYPDE